MVDEHLRVCLLDIQDIGLQHPLCNSLALVPSVDADRMDAQGPRFWFMLCHALICQLSIGCKCPADVSNTAVPAFDRQHSSKK